MPEEQSWARVLTGSEQTQYPAGPQINGVSPGAGIPSVSYCFPYFSSQHPPGTASLAGPEVTLSGSLDKMGQHHIVERAHLEARQSKFKPQFGHKHTVWAWANYFNFRALSIL